MENHYRAEAVVTCGFVSQNFKKRRERKTRANAATGDETHAQHPADGYRYLAIDPRLMKLSDTCLEMRRRFEMKMQKVTRTEGAGKIDLPNPPSWHLKMCQVKQALSSDQNLDRRQK